MKNLHLLIVEDDPTVIDTYKREIKSHNNINKSNGITIIHDIVQNKETAIERIKDTKQNFDGAIIDLDLLGTGGKDSSGNDVIREIKNNNFRFPVFVLTGTPQNVEEDLIDESMFFKIRSRDSQEEKSYWEQFVDIYNTGIVKIINQRGIIEQHLTNIFRNNLSKTIDLWIKDTNRSPEEKEKSLLRYVLLHMQEYLDEEKCHPSEFYITKPVKQQLSTGDLIVIKKNRYIVLTPACDLIFRSNGNRNVNKVFLLKVKELIEEFPQYDNTQTIGQASNTLKGKLEKIIRNNKSYYHFIPKHNTIEAGIIDFQDKLSIPIEEIENKIEENEIERIATISLPFLKDLIERYSSYYSRQGSPDFETNEIINSLFQ